MQEYTKMYVEITCMFTSFHQE